MFEPKLWVCRSWHCFFKSKSVFPVERDRRAFLHKKLWCSAPSLPVCLYKCYFPAWSLGNLSSLSRMLCALQAQALFPLKKYFGKWKLWVSFQPLKTCQVREKTKLSELMFFLVCRNLFFDKTTKPLALASSAVSHSFICGQESSAC